MMFRTLKLNQKGYTLIEMAIATAILATMATTVIMANRFVNKQSVVNADQTFGTEKAIQMYEELRALVNGNEQLGVGVLDNYSNGSNFDKILTTDSNVDLPTTNPAYNPSDPLSGNTKSDGNWRYMRQVEVNRLANDAYARQVTVKVYLYPGDFNTQTKPGVLLATVGGVMRTSAQPYVPTQVMDLYVIDINNIPSWWSVLPTLSGYMQSDIADMATRVTGLQLRTHYITRTSYGRDYYYQPETNSSANPTESTHQQWVYFYPGIIPQDAGAPDNWYYDPATGGDSKSLLMTGNFMVDGTSYPISSSQFGGAENVGYSVADQYNNAMRYPDEMAAYQAVTAAAPGYIAQGGIIQEGVTEISERMLLEGMLSQPQSFENSIIVNLHGELLPLPPMRDYSDAAKDPGNQLASANPAMACSIALTAGTTTYTNQNVRVVTHPELIYYPGAASNATSVIVRLRVYAYYDSENTGGVLPLGDPRVPAISLFFPDSAATVVGVTAIVGDGSSPREYTYQSPPGPYGTTYNGTVPNDDPAAFPGPMSMTASMADNQTLITLYNTPLRCAQASLAATPSVQGEVNPEAQPQVACGSNVVFDSATTITHTGTSANFAHTCSDSADLLVVQVSIQDTGNNAGVGQVTYNGINLSQAVSFQWRDGDMETWYLVSPPTGASHNIIVTSNDSSQVMHIGAISYSGVNTSSPIGATSTLDDGRSNNHSINLTTTAKDSLISGFFEEGGNDTITDSQTERWIEKDNNYTLGDDKQTNGNPGTYTMSYSLSGSDRAGLEAVEIIAVGCGPNTPTATNTAVDTATFTNTATVTKTNTPAPTNTLTNTATTTPTKTPPGAAPTNTYTNTPLPTSTPVPQTYGGLNSADLLYGSEYIPSSPDMTSATSNLTTTNYNNNSYTFTNADLTSTAKGPGVPKNTARWIISVSMPITQVYGGAVTIMGTVYNLGTTVAGQHTIETRLGAAVTASAVTISGAAVTIYPNLSRTYVWTGDAFMPPYTEQYQFLGDPRDCPYLDVKVGGVSIASAAITIGPNAYNWWFKNGSTGEMATDGYAGFGASGANNYWSGGLNSGSNVQVDLPRFYQLIRQGLLKTTSIWTNTNGWNWFYYGIGGEIGSDQAPTQPGVIMYDDLFKTAPGGAVTAGFNAIYFGDGNDGSHGKGLWVASNITGSNSVTWYQRSWLGEIYPDKAYLNSWVPYGNLPSVANSTIAGVTATTGDFYLEPMENVNDNPAISAGGGGKSDDGFEATTFWPNPGGEGAESFYNGQSTTTGKFFEHTSPGIDAPSNEYSLGVTTYSIYPFPLPSVVDVNRPWDFNTSASAPSEWGLPPYAGMTTALDIPTITSDPASPGTPATTSRLFYDFNGQGTASVTQGSGVIRMTQVSGGATQVGYVVETGTAPSGSVGVQTLAETALIYAMRTFLDGGQMAATGAPGHIAQIPLVQIFPSSVVPQYNETQSVAVTIGSPVTATAVAGGAASIGWPVTNIWWRFNPNALANYYTEEYPQYNSSAAMTGTGLYQEAVSVIYNLKFSPNAGVTWAFVQDGSAAVSGVCDCNLGNAYPGNATGHAVTLTAPWTYSWPVASGSTTLAQGDYLLMVEAYRQNYPEHYAYDIYDFEISW